MKLDQIYDDAKALRDVVNTLLDFIASRGLNKLSKDAVNYVMTELDMSVEDAMNLIEEGIQ